MAKCKFCGAEVKIGQRCEYTVEKGDCLYSIAKAVYGNGTQIEKILEANPEIKNPNLIYPGQKLKIPF